MRAYVEGNAQALEEIFERYAPLLLHVMERRLPAREDARDLVQQTFLQLHRARADFDPSQRLRPWLFSIAFNLLREYFRGKQRLMEIELQDGHLPVRPHGATRSDAMLDIERVLPRLTPEQRDVVELHWLAEMTFPEVAEVVGTTVGNTRVRAHRAYVRLRELLADATPARELRNAPPTRAV